MQKIVKALIALTAFASAPCVTDAAAQEMLKKINGDTVYTLELGNYDLTDQEFEAAIAIKPMTADALVERGIIFLSRDRLTEAGNDLDQAIALNPKNGVALTWRGFIYRQSRKLDEAGKYFGAALAINPKNGAALFGVGSIAAQQGRFRDAIIALTKVLEIKPDHRAALAMRAESNWQAGNADAAFDDASAALKLSPGTPQLYLYRIRVLQRRGQSADVRAAAKAVMAAFPNDTYAYVIAAKTFQSLKDPAEAMQALDRAIAIKPEAYIYLNRFEVRPMEDVAGRNADLDAALLLDPDMVEALLAKAGIQAQAGDTTGSIENLSKALKKSPNDVNLLVSRGLNYVRQGDTVSAERDFVEARTKAASNGTLLNFLCWRKAVDGIALESGLIDCNAALKVAPNMAAFLDSRGLILLRLGRYDEAITDYDEVLARMPAASPSQFGRAVAWARKGDKIKSNADFAAAMKSDPGIQKIFAGYGVTL